MARNPWLDLGFNAWMLTLEATTVIGLRTLKIATGGARAAAEMELMSSEKIEAAFALQTMAVSGRLGTTAPTAASRILTHYRRKVRANRRRLVKKTPA
jgi:hypothetical protein